MALAWLFRDYDKSPSLAFVSVWIGIMIAPLEEELVFRGYLFSGVDRLLSRWTSCARWLTVIVIAAVFALSHSAKAGITAGQLSPSSSRAPYTGGCGSIATRQFHRFWRTCPITP